MFPIEAHFRRAVNADFTRVSDLEPTMRTPRHMSTRQTICAIERTAQAGSDASRLASLILGTLLLLIRP